MPFSSTISPHWQLGPELVIVLPAVACTVIRKEFRVWNTRFRDFRYLKGLQSMPPRPLALSHSSGSCLKEVKTDVMSLFHPCCHFLISVTSVSLFPHFFILCVFKAWGAFVEANTTYPRPHRDRTHESFCSIFKKNFWMKAFVGQSFAGLCLFLKAFWAFSFWLICPI